MKPTEIREMSTDEIISQLDETREELMRKIKAGFKVIKF